MTSRYSKPGYVYVGNSTRRDGTVMQYTGSTTRTVKIREREHKREVAKKNSKTWTGQGTDFKVTGSYWSKNPRSDEKKLKKMSRSERNKFISKKNKSSNVKKKASTRRKSSTKKPVRRRSVKKKSTYNRRYWRK